LYYVILYNYIYIYKKKSQKATFSLKIAKRSFPVQVTASLSIKVKMEAFLKSI
jgi:hypothetical protein